MHRSKDDNPAFLAALDALDARGFTRDIYKLRDTFFNDWNYGVWTHEWTVVKASCSLCHQSGPAVQVNDRAVCLNCLNQQPLVPWHPTGAVRPKATALLRHAMSCTSHSWLPTQPPKNYGDDSLGS